MIKEILSLVNLSHILNFINPFLTQQHLEYIKASINKFLLIFLIFLTGIFFLLFLKN